MSNWFNVSKDGLANILARRGKSWAVFELVQNAWDSGATSVEVHLTAEPGVAMSRLSVDDNSPEGWGDLSDAFTMFGQSRRAADPTKRGRFCFGEKMVLALCKEASIVTMSGAVKFDADGRHVLKSRRESGTLFEGLIKMTRDEMAMAIADTLRLIPPVGTRINGAVLPKPELLKTFSVKLPTQWADADNNLRPSIRMTDVEVYATGDDGGEILEMGIPVCSADFPWRLNVMQKVPLSLDRDSVTDAFRRALQVAAVNAMASTLREDQAVETWATEAIADSRITGEALGHVMTARFGDRAVVAVPGDPMANATAEGHGYSVIHGGALPGGVWANVRKHATVPTSSQVFPTPKASEAADDLDAPKHCPLCKQRVKN